MNIDWLHLLAALVLLWFPRQALHLGGDIFRFRRQRRPKDTNPAKTREHGDPSLSFGVEFSKPRNYIDLARSLLGAYILLGLFPGFNPAFGPAPDSPVSTQYLALYLTMFVMIVGVLIQIFRFEGRMTMFPPIWYLTGLTFAMPDPKAAAFAVGLIWPINLVLPNPPAFLSIYSLLIAIFGFLFVGLTDQHVYFMAGMIFLPVLVSMLARRRLVMFSKRVKSGGSTAPMS